MLIIKSLRKFGRPFGQLEFHYGKIVNSYLNLAYIIADSNLKKTDENEISNKYNFPQYSPRWCFKISINQYTKILPEIQFEHRAFSRCQKRTSCGKLGENNKKKLFTTKQKNQNIKNAKPSSTTKKTIEYYNSIFFLISIINLISILLIISNCGNFEM